MTRALVLILLAVPLCLSIDGPVLLWVKGFHNSSLTAHVIFDILFPYTKYASHGTTLVIGSFVLFSFGKYYHQPFYRAGRDLLAGFAASGVSVQVLKHLFGRARPRLTFLPEFIGPTLRNSYDSFPSGHTAVLFCLAFVLSRHFPRYRAFFFLAAAAAGIERILCMSHFPSDVAAGALVGVLAGRILMTMTYGAGPCAPAKEPLESCPLQQARQ